MVTQSWPDIVVVLTLVGTAIVGLTLIAYRLKKRVIRASPTPSALGAKMQILRRYYVVP